MEFFASNAPTERNYQEPRASSSHGNTVRHLVYRMIWWTVNIISRYIFKEKKVKMPSSEEPMYCSQQINIPPELPDILKQFTKAAIRTQPSDVLEWSAA